MEPSFSLLILFSLSTWEIVEIWHHSALLAGWRERANLWNSFWGDLLRCPFCLAPWVAGISILLVQLPGWIGYIALTVIAAFAVARLSNLGSDLTHAWCRTPRHLGIPQDAPPPTKPDLNEP